MKVTIQELSIEAFSKFGTFGSLTDIKSTPLGGDSPGPIWFWPDVGGVLNLGPNCACQASFGVCRAAWRELKVELSEFHHNSGEGILPLDDDVYLHLAPPTGNDVLKAETIEVFRVPKGTMVVLKAGVWHHAPFAVEQEATVNTLIVLPQRTYAVDCYVREHGEVTFG